MFEDWSVTAPGRFELVGETNEHGVATFDVGSVKADLGELLAIEIGHVKVIFIKIAIFIF